MGQHNIGWALQQMRQGSKHLEKVHKALYAMEWEWSGDYGPGDSDAAVRAVVTPAAELESLAEDARKINAELSELLERVGK